MKRLTIILAIAACTLNAFAQLLPRPSPLGKSTYVVGASEISLEYFRPGVKDRVIFGGLVPYGELWRFGANASTKITTSSDLSFGEETLPAGTYALFAIPNENGDWVFVFYTKTEHGTADYREENDALRVTAKASIGAFTETMTLNVDNVRDNSASLVLLWENVRVAVPFGVNTAEVAKKNIDEAIAAGENLGEVYNNAANYYFATLQDYDTAMELVDKSLAIEEKFGAQFLKARILQKQGKVSEAIPLAEKALEGAKAAGSTGFANFISGTIDSWKE